MVGFMLKNRLFDNIHLSAVVLDEDLRHVENRAQGFNALPFPAPNRLHQNLQLKFLPLPHFLTLGLKTQQQ